MTLVQKTFLALLSCAVPIGAGAQVIELRSADEFISLSGEITGFDGTMVTIMTRVGPISIPAAEVMCLGAGCADVLQDNGFGLTAAAFAGVVDQPVAADAVRRDDLTVSFALPADQALYRTLAGAYALDNAASVTAQVDAAGQVTLDNAAGDQSVQLRIAEPGAAGDISVAATALTGRAPQAFAGPADWAGAVPGHHLLALRAFAVVAAPDTGVDAVTLDQLAAIYAGEIVNWSQIGGADMPVLPLQLPVGTPARDEMIAVVMDPAAKAIADDVLTMGDDAGMAGAVRGLPGSISLIDTGSIGDAPLLPVAGNCGIVVSPDTFNIASGDYPLLRPAMARLDTVPATTLVRDMFDSATLPASQAAMQRDGTIDFGARFQPADERNQRLAAVLTAALDPVERPVAAQMIQTLFEADRLSPTLIGGAVSSAESGWNRAMLQVLSQWLERPENTGREVIFAGFGESDTGPQAAIDASARAAEAVAEAFAQMAPALVADAGVTMTTAGFGAVSRTTCYDSHVAGPDRTRVEVWIK